MPDSDTDIWRQYCAAENELFELRRRLAKKTDLRGLIHDALHRVVDRYTALVLLLELPSDASIPHLDRLVFLYSASHSDIVAARILVGRLYEKGCRDRIVQVADDILATGGEEEFRRFAELYAQIDATLLRAHLARCARHPDPDIHETAEDWADDNDAPETEPRG